MIDSRDALFGLLPAWLRQRDLLADGVLQQLLRVIGDQAIAIENDLQRMYDDCFIETCAPWVIPYIGDLLGASPAEGGTDGVSGERRAIGHLLAARRQRGIIGALAGIAEDVGGWPAEAREVYRLLAVVQHLDHVHPERVATIRIGAAKALADLEPWGAALLGDVHAGASGDRVLTADVTGLGLAVRRSRAFAVTATQAYAIENREHCYAFSVLGNDTALFDPGAAVPISRLGFELDAGPEDAPAAADPALYGEGKALVIWADGWPSRRPDPAARARPIPVDAIIPADLSDWQYRVPKGKLAVDPQLGRIMFPLLQGPVRGSLVRVSYSYGFAMALGGGEYPRPPLAMPALVSRRRVHAQEAGPPPAGEFSSIAEAIADWRAARERQVAAPQASDPTAFPALAVDLIESGMYGGALDIVLEAGESIWLIAAPGSRPVLWLSDAEAGVQDAIAVSGAANSRFVMDGVMVAGRGLRLAGIAADDARNGVGGDLCEVLLRHCTLVPGWGITHDCEPLRPSDPSLVIDGSRLCLRIDHCITGAIEANVGMTDGPPCRIAVADSIIDATSQSRSAIGSPDATVAYAQITIARSTVVGTVSVHGIALAEDTLFRGLVTVARRQQGCVRFCYVSVDSRTPRQYRCQPATARGAVKIEAGTNPAIAAARQRLLADVALRIAPRFAAMRYGTSDYLRLTGCTPAEITRGASDGGEIGVYHELLEPQRLDQLQARLTDHCPADFNAVVMIAS